MDIVIRRSNERPQGRYRSQYNRFDSIPLEKRHYGRAKVNCCLEGGTVQWGSLQDRDIVIMHMRTDLTQEKHYRFERCVVQLSFSRDDPTVPDIPRLLDPLAPVHLKGPDNVQHRSNEASASVDLGAGPTTAGLSVGRSSEYEIKESWKYISYLEPGEDGDYQDYFTRASWSWENEGRSRNDDLSKLYSGLVLHHFSHPFRVSCSIKAKMSNNLYKFKRFKSHRQTPKITVIERPNGLPRTDLTATVDRLERDIKEKIWGAMASKLSTR
ncbi:uncharacterized protein KD926_004426 [Aspergillus affinis]|uniref:uncharacterized protein n=1 Tax=Aspergillus affinis TaxID=1070780 RepID=UPI0022FE2C77|nr:uncharacterized protein KD926_004426 [Aspergillus affinis]KAI9043242.1 hypothetical protein KD926_004426 [Aspergillus affinis]